MRELWLFCRTTGLRLWSLMSCAVFTVLAFYAAATNKGNPWIAAAMFAMAGLSFCVACYLAFRDELRAKLALEIAWSAKYAALEKELATAVDPLVLLHWRSLDEQVRHDQVEFRTSGMALEIKLGDFSRPELTWHYTIEIPFLEPLGSRIVRAEFTKQTPNAHEVGYLRRILEALPDGEELSIQATYKNAHGTLFRRIFHLRLVHVGRDREIHCQPGKLMIER